VIPATTLERVLTAGRAREDKERRFFDELRGGSTTIELLDLDPTIVDRP
jgi:hypothetical protein